MPKLVAQELYGVEEDPGPTFQLVARDKIASLNGVAFGVTVGSRDSDLAFNYRTAGSAAVDSQFECGRSMATGRDRRGVRLGAPN